MLVGIAGVQRGAVVERRAVDEVDRRVARPRGAHDRDVVMMITEPDLEVAQHHVERRAALVDPAVVGQKDSHVVTGAAEVRRQRRRHICEASRLRIARDLGRDVQNVHVFHSMAWKRPRVGDCPPSRSGAAVDLCCKD